MTLQSVFLGQTGARYPIIGGAMFPCSHPRLVAAVCKAGGIGEIQPLSFTFVHGYKLDDAISEIRKQTNSPFGINILLEGGARRYHERYLEYLDLALERGCRFVTTALGKPSEIVERAHATGAVVYHKVTNPTHAKIALDQGVDGIIAVNDRAGGHAGTLTLEELYTGLSGSGKPIICAGGIGNEQDFAAALRVGYAGVLLGTRFIASVECTADENYKNAIIRARAADIVLTERVTGVPLSVIQTDHIRRLGLKAAWWEKMLIGNANGKKLLRMYYAWLSGKSMKRAMKSGFSTRDVFQAGKSVDHIERVETVEDIIHRFVAYATKQGLLERP